MDKRIHAYRNVLPDEQFTAFKVRMITAIGAFITAEFLRRFRKAFGRWATAGTATEIIEVQLAKVDLYQKNDEPQEEFDLKRHAQRGKPTRRSLKELIPRPSFGTIGRISAKVALAAFLVIAGRAAFKTPAGQEFAAVVGHNAQRVKSYLREKLGNIFYDPDNEGFERIDPGPDQLVGVSMERRPPNGSDSPDDYLRQVVPNFVSTPGLSWGSFMSEKVENWFDGKKWSYLDNENMALPQVDFPHVRRIAHYQRIVPSPGRLKLRNLAGGRIDPQSIDLIDMEGNINPVNKIKFIPQTGEVEITIPETPKIRAVTYQTLANADWESTADSVTEDDLAALPQAAYQMLTFVSGYVTDDHQIDYDQLSKIKLQSEAFKEFNNLGDFIRHLRTLKPYERVKRIRTLVNKMRYTVTSRTQTAFEKFHSNDLPEKDLLAFAFNSAELEKQGDGDCDVQNSLFALLTRLAGVPARLDFVVTENGVGHAPASIYLPKIGWVLMDTMGERSLQEEITGESWVIHHGPQSSSAQAQEALMRRLRIIELDRQRGCGTLNE